MKLGGGGRSGIKLGPLAVVKGSLSLGDSIVFYRNVNVLVQ